MHHSKIQSVQLLGGPSVLFRYSHKCLVFQDPILVIYEMHKIHVEKSTQAVTFSEFNLFIAIDYR